MRLQRGKLRRLNEKKLTVNKFGDVVEVEVENAIRERRNRKIDLSKYTVGFDEIQNKEKRRNTPNPAKVQSTMYDRYRKKLEDGQLDKFNSRDLLYFFSDTANSNGVKYVIGNCKIGMRHFKLAKERGYSNEDLLAMIEFLFTSGQTYLAKEHIHTGILVSNWCNTIYNDTQLWLKDEYNPNKKSNYNKPVREWTETSSDESKSSVGEWD